MKTPRTFGQLMDYAEAARFLGVPKGTLYAWVNGKQIPHIRLSGRTVRFDRKDLERWLAEHHVLEEE